MGLIAVQKRSLTSLKKHNLYDYSGQIVPEGIKKESDINQGDSDTKYTLTGEIVEAPVLANKLWVVKISVDGKKYQISLGNSDDKLGTNEAINGVLSNMYNTSRVSEIIPKLKKTTPIIVHIVTAYSGVQAHSPECDQRCQDLVRKIDEKGQQVQTLLEGNFGDGSDILIIEPVLQITFAPL